MEHHRTGNDRSSLFSDQSSTKSMGYVLLNRALAAGALTLDDPVESYVPEVGPGFAGRTVGDVASMAVNHHVAELTYVESRYYKSAIHNEYGLGHSGWGGQLLWADPESGTIIAANSLLASELPAPHDHFNKLYHAAIDIVTHFRAAD